MRLIRINYCVMPDLIRHPEYLAPSFLDSGFRRNDKSLRLPANVVLGWAALKSLLHLKARVLTIPERDTKYLRPESTLLSLLESQRWGNLE